MNQRHEDKSRESHESSGDARRQNSTSTTGRGESTARSENTGRDENMRRDERVESAKHNPAGSHEQDRSVGQSGRKDQGREHGRENESKRNVA